MTRFSQGFIQKPGAAGFLPPDIDGLELWFDADDAGTIGETAGEVQTWTSKGGNTAVLTAFDGASEPNTADDGGFNALEFDGGDGLKNDTVSPEINTSPVTKFMAFRTTVTGGFAFPFYILSVDNNDQVFFQFLSSDSVVCTAEVTAGSNSSATLGGIIDTNRTIVIDRHEDGVAADALDDEAASATGAVAGTIITLCPKVAIGKSSFSAQPFTGFIYECGCYNRRLDDSERTTLMNYLKNKWGL